MQSNYYNHQFDVKFERTYYALVDIYDEQNFSTGVYEKWFLKNAIFWVPELLSWVVTLQGGNFSIFKESNKSYSSALSQQICNLLFRNSDF
jgi:hypothetical protein